MELEFFDCNTYYGYDTAQDAFRPIHTVQALRQEMARAGVRRAVVSRVEQAKGSMLAANDLLADDIKGTDDLHGTWAIVPTHTHELPAPADMPAAMKANRILGWRLYPARARFLVKPFALRDWLEVAVLRRIPVFVSTADGTTLEQAADLLEAFPTLTMVLTYANEWPSDRQLRPFVAAFPNVYLDLTYLMTDGGVESFVEEYGASRLLYGSGFPHFYFGGHQLMLRHAQIADQDKVAIAGGNLARILQEVAL
jgi:predicted TIM-barrel fold metal-dependent hydrolase